GNSNKTFLLCPPHFSGLERLRFRKRASVHFIVRADSFQQNGLATFWPKGQTPWWVRAAASSQDFLHDLSRRCRAAFPGLELSPRLLHRLHQLSPALFPQPALENRDEVFLFLWRQPIRPLEH